MTLIVMSHQAAVVDAVAGRRDASTRTGPSAVTDRGRLLETGQESARASASAAGPETVIDLVSDGGVVSRREVAAVLDTGQETRHEIEIEIENETGTETETAIETVIETAIAIRAEIETGTEITGGTEVVRGAAAARTVSDAGTAARVDATSSSLDLTCVYPSEATQTPLLVKAVRNENTTMTPVIIKEWARCGEDVESRVTSKPPFFLLLLSPLLP